MSIFEYLKVYLVSDGCSKWVIYMFGVSERDRKSTFFRTGGMVSIGYLKFLAFFCGVYVYACVCVCVCVYVRVCVCVCMRVIHFADVIVPNTIYIKEKMRKASRQGIG